MKERVASEGIERLNTSIRDHWEATEFIHRERARFIRRNAQRTCNPEPEEESEGEWEPAFHGGEIRREPELGGVWR
jgi:hypothetical protein